MQTLIAATHNAHKLREFREIFAGWNIDADSPDAEETENTFAGNALIKARACAARHPGAWIIADDSGLCVDALGGAPGVFSARYAGPGDDDEANNALLLRNLKGAADRSAHYECAIALIEPDGAEHLFEGRCCGRITETPSGTGGFGYDPLFIPDGSEKTFANFAPADKNAISHRGKALALMRQWLAENAHAPL
ncbi:MAG: RdgB/HAM1 family non-canonical purine NTP pyrophosphatase [Kiritimatiellae bacterium]|nr:RdgB/HAM1 family non-canonical purine NTP pyrophosphatase [Kiritimatiellia bacterium]